jgi:hypothetical protein
VTYVHDDVTYVHDDVTYVHDDVTYVSLSSRQDSDMRKTCDDVAGDRR